MKLILIISGEIILGIIGLFMLKRKSEKIKARSVLYWRSTPVKTENEFLMLDENLREQWKWDPKQKGFLRR